MIWAWLITLVVVALICFVIVRLSCRKSYVIAKAKSQVRKVLGNNKVMLIRNYNNDGGFFWQIYNILNMLFLCEEYGFKPVVMFDSGLYFEKRRQFVDKMHIYDKSNWFNHFFLPINESGQTQDFWVDYLEKNKTLPVYEYRKTPSPVMIFDRKTLKSISNARGRIQSYTKMWHQYIRPQPHILKQVADFKMKHKLDGKHLIGMHFRGTDKFASSSGNEDEPLHYEYKFCLDLLREYLNTNGLNDPEKVCVFIASDEQPFVEFIEEAGLPITVVSTDSIRSGVSTSGLVMDTSQCARGKIQNEVCRKFNELITESVHRGFPDTSKYVKGEDVLLDVLLLSGSNAFFRSRGNVSNFVGYINPECKIMDMVNLYKKKNKV
jgi:hypothetical protein